MNAEEYQHFATSTHAPLEKPEHELALGVDYITSEGGELANLVNKVRWQCHPMTDELLEKMRKELSDVMWGVAVAAHALGMTLPDVWNTNHAKLSTRYNKGRFTVEDSIARVDVAPEVPRMPDLNGNVYSGEVAEDISRAVAEYVDTHQTEIRKAVRRVRFER